MRGFSATHAYVHRLADVHLAGFAPAFTLSLCVSEYARKPPVPIASVVSGKHEKKKTLLLIVTIRMKSHLSMTICLKLKRLLIELNSYDLFYFYKLFKL